MWVRWRVGQRQRLIPSSSQETIYGGSLRTIVRPAFYPWRVRARALPFGTSKMMDLVDAWDRRCFPMA
jgi:hypothetical protein